MNHSEFAIGGMFWCDGGQWRCTDIGRRVIVGVRVDRVEVGSNAPALRRMLGAVEAQAGGWFSGPPYAVAESVFDEDDMQGCTTEKTA